MATPAGLFGRPALRSHHDRHGAISGRGHGITSFLRLYQAHALGAATAAGGGYFLETLLSHLTAAFMALALPP